MFTQIFSNILDSWHISCYQHPEFSIKS